MGFMDTEKFISQKIGSLIQVNSVKKLTKRYIKKNGTYVMPHYKTRKDGTRLNNYSTKGNVNPYTGKKGYRKLR